MYFNQSIAAKKDIKLLNDIKLCEILSSFSLNYVVQIYMLKVYVCDNLSYSFLTYPADCNLPPSLTLSFDTILSNGN